MFSWFLCVCVCVCAGERLGHGASASVCRTVHASEGEETPEIRSRSSSNGKQTGDRAGIMIWVTVWPLTYFQTNSIKSCFLHSVCALLKVDPAVKTLQARRLKFSVPDFLKLFFLASHGSEHSVWSVYSVTVSTGVLISAHCSIFLKDINGTMLCFREVALETWNPKCLCLTCSVLIATPISLLHHIIFSMSSSYFYFTLKIFLLGSNST